MSSSSIFRIPPLPNPPVPLPQVPGPKLAPFTPTAHAGDIEFIRFLGRENDKDSYVWKVKIDGEGPYALKMFRCFQWKYLQEVGYLACHLRTPQQYINYLDPFNCECRVYGRLKEENREDLAVKVHGYLILTPEQETVVTKKILGCDSDDDSDEDKARAATELDGYNAWGRYEEHRGYPIRAIVKQLVTDYGPLQAEHFPQMWPDLEGLHKLGILVRDLHVGNYMGGKLIDFSRSWTMYHPSLDRIRLRDVQEMLQQEASELEDLLFVWLNRHRTEGVQPEVPQSLQDCALGENGNYGTDPREYDWRKGEKSVEVADAYVAKTLFTDGDT